MKIIKEGIIPKGVEIFEVKCDRCSTLFEHTEYECKWTSHASLDINCPICGAINSVDDIEIPYNHFDEKS